MAETHPRQCIGVVRELLYGGVLDTPLDHSDIECTNNQQTGYVRSNPRFGLSPLDPHSPRSCKHIHLTNLACWTFETAVVRIILQSQAVCEKEVARTAAGLSAPRESTKMR